MFFSFDGPDGVGKSTQIKRFDAHLPRSATKPLFAAIPAAPAWAKRSAGSCWATSTRA